MKVAYYTTEHFIRHQDNVIDLAEYRRRLAQVDGSLALAQPEEPAAPAAPERSRRPRPVRRLADWLDMAASVATVAVVLCVWIQLML